MMQMSLPALQAATLQACRNNTCRADFQSLGSEVTARVDTVQPSRAEAEWSTSTEKVGMLGSIRRRFILKLNTLTSSRTCIAVQGFSSRLWLQPRNKPWGELMLHMAEELSLSSYDMLQTVASQEAQHTMSE